VHDGLWATKSGVGLLSVQLVFKIFSLCAPDPPTVQTDRQRKDRQTDDMQSQYGAVHYSASRAVKKNYRLKPKTPLSCTWVYSKFEWPISSTKLPLNIKNGGRIEFIVTVNNSSRRKRQIKPRTHPLDKQEAIAAVETRSEGAWRQNL